MPGQAEANRAAIIDVDARLAISRMVLAIFVDHSGMTGVTHPEERVIYFAALEATILGRRLTKAKLAEATGIPRSTLTRHLEQLLRKKIILYFAAARSYAVSAEFANSQPLLARNAVCRRAFEQCYAVLHSGANDQNGQSPALRTKMVDEQ